MIQYRVDSAPPAPSRQCFAAAADGPPPFEIVESLSKTTVSCLYLLARCEPELLRGVWKSSAFLETYIFPALPDQRQPARAALTSSSELTDVTKRGVAIRYRIADDVILAKFLRRDLQGAQTYEILRAAWSGGLGAGQPYQVPRPLAYYPDRRLLLTMAIDGVALDQSLAGDIDELIRACQDAARWLLKFHATPLEAGAEHGDSRNGRAQTLSAQAAPNDGRRTLEQNEAYAGLVRDLWAELELRAEAERQLTRAVVPIHGKFGPENVLLSDGITAAINFDRSRLDEPALDLARFMLQLWKRIFKDTGQWKRAEIAANAFLTEYGSAKPEILASLPYYWGEKILKSLEHHTGHPSYRGLNESLDQVVRFHEAQFKFAGRCEAGMPRL